MKMFSLILRNAFRHRLRSILTIAGIATAVMAFGLLRTVIAAWNAGVTNASTNRMIVRNRVSFIFPLPITDLQQLQRVAGVSGVSWANWFGGVYGNSNDFKNFWARFAVDPASFFALYPEYVVPPDQFAAFQRERNACIIGQRLATEKGFKLGDVITMDGDIFPGRWEFVVRGIYTGKDPSVDQRQMFFQWDYLDQQVKQREPGRNVNAGWYVLKVAAAGDMPTISATIDTTFTNSQAPTKTESEKAFQQGFVAMSSTIITSLQVVSFVIIGIILLVLANTIVMAVRERTREYAILKTLGFTGRHIATFILGESLVIGVLGGLLGLLLIFPMLMGVKQGFSAFFPVIGVSAFTTVLVLGVAALSGLAAAALPAARAVRLPIVTGLRTVG
jgi:putative ABC transport system permease protein